MEQEGDSRTSLLSSLCGETMSLCGARERLAHISSLDPQRDGHFPGKSPRISVPLVKNDLQLKAREVMCKRIDACLSVQQEK